MSADSTRRAAAFLLVIAAIGLVLFFVFVPAIIHGIKNYFRCH